MSLRPSTKTEVRRNGYMVAINSDEGRRRREDTMVEIRKSKHEESLLKKRREGLQPQQFPASVHASTVEKKLESLPSMVAGVSSNDNNLQLEATTQFQKLLSIERSPPIEEVIQSGVVPRFVEFLMREDFPQLQFEAAWRLQTLHLVHLRIPGLLWIMEQSPFSSRFWLLQAMMFVSRLCRQWEMLLVIHLGVVILFLGTELCHLYWNN